VYATCKLTANSTAWSAWLRVDAAFALSSGTPAALQDASLAGKAVELAELLLLSGMPLDAHTVKVRQLLLQHGQATTLAALVCFCFGLGRGVGLCATG
jgi:hypothetical protein